MSECVCVRVKRSERVYVDVRTCVRVLCVVYVCMCVCVCVCVCVGSVTIQQHTPWV